jgi:putative membrane protein
MPIEILAHAKFLVPPAKLWSSWTFEPFVVGSLILSAFFYARGVRRLWSSAGTGKGVTYGRVLAFAAGELALVIALVSPLDALGGTLLSAHMAQHGVLAGIAPPLLMLGRPGVAFAWVFRWKWIGRVTHALAAPMRATVLLGITMWVWHAPALFNAAVSYEWVHALQHICFLVPALLFWQAVLDGRHRAAPAFLAAFFTFMHTGLLGGLLTMAPEPLYAAYFGHTGLWGMTELQDQQLAGLLMWLPMGIPYLMAGLVLASRLIRLDPQRADLWRGTS